MSKYINSHKSTSQKAMRIRWNTKNNLRLERMREKKTRKERDNDGRRDGDAGGEA